MTSRLVSNGQKINLSFTVSTEAQARELDAAWREIIAGKQPRTEVLERDQAAITSRALVALETIETAIRQNPTTGHAGRLVRFIARVYNGQDYPFDLPDLRALDTRLANGCLDYLNYDRLAKREIHHHLSRGERELHEWLEEYGLEASQRFAVR